MRKTLVILASTALLAAGLTTASPALAAPPVGDDPGVGSAPSDDLSNPLEAQRRQLRQEAITAVLNGEATPEQRGTSTVVNLGGVSADSRSSDPPKDKYVELTRETTDRVFVILAEFGDQPSPDGRVQPDPNAQRTDGPLHNEIPEPDRSTDNSTIWQPDYDQAHYQDLYFGDDESLRTYYETQSSGRYSVNGEVTDWVKVPYSEYRYGTDLCDPDNPDDDASYDVVCDTVWDLVADAADVWYQDQLAQGRSVDEVNADLASFDVADRYDYDGDGDFNEPDGYIDHFQIVHAGGDEADGDPVYASDAIWSHRWYAFVTDAGRTGPEANPAGGTEIADSGIWIGDYTMQPENGGRSVFYHEYGHDLGLPDDYDTAGGRQNNNEWWTLMAQSRLTAATDAGIGERGGDLGAWNKLQLGWLDYEVVQPGTFGVHRLGPEEYNTARPQALIVPLPQKGVDFDLGAPYSGALQWYSGDGNGLENTLTREVAVPAGSPALTFQARWDIEAGYDYAYVEVDDGSGFVPIPGNITDPEAGNGIDGLQPEWTPATFDLSAYAGTTVSLRFRYTTDTAVGGNDPTVPNGLFLDDIGIDGVFFDDAEADDGGWTPVGFSRVGATTTGLFDNYYIASYRSYTSYDQYLQTGPYNFGFTPADPDRVEHFPYQQGLLISYWDTSYTDNNTSEHPGGGLNLYIDSHPRPFTDVNGALWRGRVQLYDAPFGLRRTDSLDLHVQGVPSPVRGGWPNPFFNDRSTYWYASQPDMGVILPGIGVRMIVTGQRGTSMTVLTY